MNKIYVTQPSMPPLAEFLPYLKEIWDNKILTNSGPFHIQLENQLAEYLGVRHISLFSNATIGLVTALQALRITGEVITTPYSFVATAHSLLWNGVRPVFIDIDERSFCLDPDKIEAAITPQTTAIMPVHVYGYPCNVDRIERIADDYGLKVIYDAAHAFGVWQGGQSVLNHGDLSVLSFHATKVFNTFEGGAIISRNAKMKLRVDRLKNFGFVDETTVVAPGINGKMNEIQAAFGLLQLKHLDAVLVQRKRVDTHYRQLLKAVPGIHIPDLPDSDRHNYSYFPVMVTSEFKLSRDGLYDVLKQHDIFSRRYFYPLISDFPMYRGLPSAASENLPVARRVAREILCLPIYPDLDEASVERVASIVVGASR